MMTTLPDGNVLVPQAGSASGGFPGNVLEFDHSSFPTSASQCPDGRYPRSLIRSSVFFQATTDDLPVPMGVAHDPTCNCYAISSIFGGGADDAVIKWFTASGTLVDRPSVAGESLADFGSDPNGFNPFGMAFAPDGTLYFVDIHITCSGPLTNCGPTNYEGRVMSVRFGSGRAPRPPTTVAGHFAFPTSVTICVPARQRLSLPRPTRPRCRPPRVPLKGNDRVPRRLRRPLRLARLGILLATVLVAAGCSSGAENLAASTATTAPARVLPPGSWASYGNGSEHDFTGPTTLTPSSVGSLREAWFFPTGDAVTATPTVVGGVAYFGSWDTKFYAVDVATGALRWSYQLDSQTGVTPYPGQQPRTMDSDGGLVTSTAWYEPGSGSRPNLVIFGGGYTLYAIDADDGQLYWKHVYDGRPERAPSPTTDPTRIFSSPIVENGNVYFGTSTDGQPHERGTSSPPVCPPAIPSGSTRRTSTPGGPS